MSTRFYREANIAANMVRYGKADSVVEAYQIIDGEYEAEPTMSGRVDFNYKIYALSDTAYIQLLHNKRLCPSVANFVSVTIDYHTQVGTDMHPAAIY